MIGVRFEWIKWRGTFRVDQVDQVDHLFQVDVQGPENLVQDSRPAIGGTTVIKKHPLYKDGGASTIRPLRVRTGGMDDNRPQIQTGEKQ